MRRMARFPQLITHSVVAVIVTVLTVLLGGPFLRMIRVTQGSLRYWSAGAVVALAFLLLGAEALAVFLASLWITVGLYSELEQRGRGWRTSGMISLTVGTLMGFAGFYAILRGVGITTWEGFVDLVREKSELFWQLGPSLKMDSEMLAQWAPSFWITCLILNLGMALIFERPLFAWFGFPRERVASHLRLLEFRLPDAFVWLALTGLLLSLVDFGSKPLAFLGSNLVSVFSVLYFFQGLAVLEVLLNSMKAGAFLRMVVYLILVGQFFPLLSLVGLIDFWVDFRRRLRVKKKVAGGPGDGGTL